MGLILISIFLVILGAILYKKNSYDDDLELFGSIFFWVGVVFLFIFLIAIPISRLSLNSDIVAFKSVQVSLDEARSNPVSSGYEAVAIQSEVFEQNKWLAENKFLANKWFFSIFYPTKKLNELEPIK